MAENFTAYTAEEQNLKEQYKQTFAALTTDRDYRKDLEESLEKASASGSRRVVRRKRRWTSAVAAVVLSLAIAATGVCYATDAGGIRRNIQIWLHGDQTDATFTYSDNGEYTLSYSKNRQSREISGGGVAIEDDGAERPLTQAEILEDLGNDAELVTESDGRKVLYYKNMSQDVTDLFDKDGVCYITIADQESGKKMYFTLLADGSLASSPYRYMIPGKDFSSN